jgi:hypothetical protein
MPATAPAPPEGSVLNFAYGSNLLTRRILARVPSAQLVSVATLAGHRLCWHKLGRDGSGKCDVLPTGHPLDRVIGVVYRMRTADKPLLDRIEGLGSGYDEEEVSLSTAAGPMRAWTYRATDIDSTAVPFTVQGPGDRGRARTCIPGCLHSGLEGVAARDDPDTARAQTFRSHRAGTVGSADGRLKIRARPAPPEQPAPMSLEQSIKHGKRAPQDTANAVSSARVMRPAARMALATLPAQPPDPQDVAWRRSNASSGNEHHRAESTGTVSPPLR